MARVSLSERNRELASLRVLGFTRGEISYILLGELALLTLAAIPVGLVLGHALAAVAVAAYETEAYRVESGAGALSGDGVGRVCGFGLGGSAAS